MVHTPHGADLRAQPKDSIVIGPLDVYRLLRRAGGALLTQAALHGELARVEWAQEKSRLLKMLGVALLGLAALFCTLLFAGLLVLAASWDTAYRSAGVAAVTILYGLATFFAWQRFKLLAALGDLSFAATREELAADMALLRSER